MLLCDFYATFFLSARRVSTVTSSGQFQDGQYKTLLLENFLVTKKILHILQKNYLPNGFIVVEKGMR